MFGNVVHILDFRIALIGYTLRFSLNWFSLNVVTDDFSYSKFTKFNLIMKLSNFLIFKSIHLMLYLYLNKITYDICCLDNSRFWRPPCSSKHLMAKFKCLNHLSHIYVALFIQFNWAGEYLWAKVLVWAGALTILWHRFAYGTVFAVFIFPLLLQHLCKTYIPLKCLVVWVGQL